MGIGIDFGTTNSAAIFADNNGNLTLGVEDQDAQGARPDSSKVWVSNAHVTHFGGTPVNPDIYSPVRELKWYLGNQPDFGIDGRTYNATDLSTKYIQWIKNRLANMVGTGVKKDGILTVASVPNRSWPGYRQRLRKCLTDAGFNSVRLVYEPTAAAVACLHEAGALNNPAKFAGPVLVIDWGGGTVDVSLLELKPNRTLVDINTEGKQSGIGGGDMDEWLAQKAAENGNMVFALKQLDRNAKNTLLAAIEYFKIKCIQNFDLGLDCKSESIVVPNTSGRTITITSNDVKDCVSHFCQNVQEIALGATSAAGIANDDVRYKIFVGGPFQSKFIRENAHFSAWRNAQSLTYSLGTQLATAAGCALLARRGFNLYLACDIGVMEPDGGFFTVAHRHESMPAGNPSSLKSTLRRQQFDVTDLACTNAVFEFARNSGLEGRQKFIPMGIAQVPVCHTVFGGVTPFSPIIEEATLDCDLNFGVQIIGRKGGVHNPGPDEIIDRKQFDCLPLEVELPQWFT